MSGRLFGRCLSHVQRDILGQSSPFSTPRCADERATQVTSNESSKAEGSSVENVPVQVIAMRQSLKVQSERLDSSAIDPSSSSSNHWETGNSPFDPDNSTAGERGREMPFSSLSENPGRWRGDIVVVREMEDERA